MVNTAFTLTYPGGLGLLDIRVGWPAGYSCGLACWILLLLLFADKIHYSLYGRTVGSGSHSKLPY
jgi:hypothetical protein